MSDTSVTSSSILPRERASSPVEDSRSRRQALIDELTTRYNITGDKYHQMAANAINAYYDTVQNTNKGVGDTVSGFFGRSGYDKIIDSARQQLYAELQEIYDLSFENEYNSPAESASRLRAAGINPDLQGLGDAGTAGENAEPQDVSAAIREAPTGMEQFGSVIKGALQVYSSIASIRSVLAGTRLSNANASRVMLDTGVTEEVDIPEKKYSFFKKTFNRIHSSKEIDKMLHSDYEDGFELDVPDDTTLKSVGLRSKKQRDEYRAFQEAYVNSFEFAADAYRSEGDFLESEEKVVEKRANPYRSDGNPFDSSFVKLPNGKIVSTRRSLHDEFTEGLRAMNQYRLEVEKLQNQFQKEYYSIVSGRAKAQSENSKYKFDFEYFDSANGGLKGQMENAVNKLKRNIENTKSKCIDGLISSDNAFSQALALEWLGETKGTDIFSKTLGKMIPSFNFGFDTKDITHIFKKSK